IPVADVAQRVAAEPGFDLLRERVRPRPEAVLRAVRAPLDGLHAVQAFRQSGERDVENRDAAPGIAQMSPERLALEPLAGQAAVRLVRARLELHPGIHAALRRVDARLERRPGRTGEDA